MLGFDGGETVHQSVLYKAIGAKASFRKPLLDNYVQKVPHWKKVSYREPLLELLSFIAYGDEETFARAVEEILDVDSVIDFTILLNLTNNRDGPRHNLFLARGGGEDDRFFIIPWDYDSTYKMRGWLSNYLVDRLNSQLPGYTDRLLARWRELRQGVLSEGAVMARIDTMEEALADGSAERNQRRWRPPGNENSYRKDVEALRSWIHQRLRKMDRWIEETAVIGR
jgi:spore coat protein CotH